MSCGHTHVPFLPKLLHVSLPLAVGLWEGEQEVKGRGGNDDIFDDIIDDIFNI